jgi:putative restriction endonuclease
MGRGTKWTRDDELVVLWLYYTLKGSTDKGNPEVIAISHLLGKDEQGDYRHSANSVAIKLTNYRACDPNRIGGMSHISKDDTYYFNAYHDKTEQLFATVQEIISRQTGTGIPKIDVYPDIPEFSTDQYTRDSYQYHVDDKTGIVNIRTKQYQFRTELLNIYDGKCCLTGIGSKELLIASHIKPWAIDKDHRTDPRNGLLLNALLDRAFDQGLFTVDPIRYTVRVSNKITDQMTKATLSFYDSMPIRLPDKMKWNDCNPSKDFLEYHNDVIFEHSGNNS